QPRLLFLRAHHPERQDLAVARRLRLEEAPRGAVGLEAPRQRRLERGGFVLERIAIRAVRISTLVSVASGPGDAAFGQKLLDALQVDRAPHAGRRPRRKALRAALIVESLPDAVDPSETQRFVERLLIGHPAPARRLLIEAHPQLTRRGAMRLEPGTKVGR